MRISILRCRQKKRMPDPAPLSGGISADSRVCAQAGRDTAYLVTPNPKNRNFMAYGRDFRAQSPASAHKNTGAANAVPVF